MSQFNPADHPHRRLNPLTGEYILVSPHRTKRPWQGRTEETAPDDLPEYDEKCYLCPGNTRANGEVNPDYKSTFVFTNDFAALLPDVPESGEATNPLFKLESVQGTSRVICFSPKHNLTLAEMSPEEIREVVDLWADQNTELGAIYKWVQIFENRGKILGGSNPHPHGQIWASNRIPNEPLKEDSTQRAYYAEHGRPMLLDYVEQEIEQGERILAQNDYWVALVPFWAMWPFETLVLPRQHIRRMEDLDDAQRNGLADSLKKLLVKYDNLFETSWPYSMGWHGAPFNDDANDHWQLHAHFYPPLLRSATVRKFMVGYEMMAEAQRDLTPEQAAARLNALSDVHYKLR